MEDCIIIGAGAAGLFAAGAAVHAGKRVTVLEHMDAPGKKLLITGKGRCNVTNNCGPDAFLKNVRRNPRFLYSALNACPPAFVMELLEKGLGVPLKTERGRRVFPQSDRAQDVLDALLRWAKGARLRYEGAPGADVGERPLHGRAPAERRSAACRGRARGNGRRVLSGDGLHGRRLPFRTAGGPHRSAAGARALFPWWSAEGCAGV